MWIPLAIRTVGSDPDPSLLLTARMIGAGRLAAALAVTLLLALPVHAADPDCPRHFAQARVPTLTNPKLAARTVPLCFEAFAILYSPVSRTPVYAAERLTRASVTAARRIDRTDDFHEEPRLPFDARSTLEDYVRSGYDRGHMAPAADMPTAAASTESFSLANIVPQNRTSNRSIWAAIEESVRRMALRRGEIFVVTGTIFSGGSIASLDGRVLVPTQLFKAIYDPARGEAGAYLAQNDDEGAWKAVSIETLQAQAGIEVFPSLPARSRAVAMSLPEPRAFTRNRREEASWGDWARVQLHRLARGIWRELMRAIF